MSTSRIPGFYKLSVHERRQLAAKALGIGVADLDRALTDGGLPVATADTTVENVIGTYSLPFSLGLNLRMNAKDYVVPMVIEEPSVVAAASNAAKMIRLNGGFTAETDRPIMIAQIQLDAVEDAALATDRILAAEAELLESADAAVPGLVRRGGGAREIVVRDLGDGMLVVHVHVDCCDAMGANLVNTVAEALAPRITELTGGQMGLRILSNLADQRCIRVKCKVNPESLAYEGPDGVRHGGSEVADAIVRASRFAEKDPYRATTHNKGIMNGVDAVVLATGNDWRAVEAGAHSFASRTGTYRPLCIWRVSNEGMLEGSLEMPIQIGIVGGPTRVHQAARLALTMVNVSRAQELAMIMGCVGMASNLAAVKALATEGIQRGHMALHARSVATAAGAGPHEVARVAAQIHALGDVSLAAAERAVTSLRAVNE